MPVPWSKFIRRFLSRKPLSPVRLARVAAIAAAAALASSYLDRSTQVFAPLEQRSYGERLEVSARVNRALVRRVQNKIVLVTFSDASADWARRRQTPGPFLPRSDHAKLIRELTRCGAKVIAFDFLFDTPQTGDAALTDAVRRSGRVLLACADADDGQMKILYPEQSLRNAGAHLGHTRIPISADQPAVDRMAPVVRDGTRNIPALSVEALNMTGDQPPPPHRAKDGRRFSGVTVPVESDGTFKIRYLGAAGEVFTSIPYETLADATPADQAFFAGSGTFRNKIVIVGDSTLIHNDLHLTPLGMMSGVEIHAHALATLLGGRFLRDASAATEEAQIGVLAALAAFLASVWRLRRAALFLVLLLPAYSLFNVWMFVERDTVLHFVAPSVTLIVTLVGVLLERGLAEEREKTQMRELLLRYVSPQIAGYLLQHPELLGRDGRRVTGTVLFSDIRGFTALSEQLLPEELVRRMNEYFQAVTDVVFRHNGTAVSMVGDAMLAVFGVPVPDPDHAYRAVAAAIEMQAVLETLQTKWQAQDQAAFDIGIGINSGEMVVGDVGGTHLMNFTVYGLQVNIASRVEALNKGLGSRILMTRSTYQALHAQGRRVDARGPMSAAMKGVEDKVEVFEVLGWRQEHIPEAADVPVAEAAPK